MRRLEELKVDIFDDKMDGAVVESDLKLKDLTDKQVLDCDFLVGISDSELTFAITPEENKKRFLKDIDEFTSNGIKLAKKLIIEEGLNPTKSEIEELKSVDLESYTEDQKAILAERIGKGLGKWDKWSDVNLVLAKAATAIKVLNDIRLITGLCKSSFLDTEKSPFSYQTNISKLMTFVDNDADFSIDDSIKNYFNLGLEAKEAKSPNVADDGIFNIIEGFCSGEYFYNGYDKIEPLTKEDILNVHLSGRVIFVGNGGRKRELYLSKGSNSGIMYAPTNFVNLFVDKIRCKPITEYNEDAVRVLVELNDKLGTIIEQKEQNPGYGGIYDILLDYSDLNADQGYFQTVYSKKDLCTDDGAFKPETLVEIFGNIIKNTIAILSGDNHTRVLVEVKDRKSGLRQYFFNHILNLKHIALIDRLLKVKPE